MLIKWSVFLIISILLSSCLVEGEKARQEKLVKDYFTALNNDDFETALNIVNDSILISEGDFVLAKSKSELLVHFRWDSVFKPRYKVLELATVDKNMEAVIAKTCQRIRFLHDSAIEQFNELLRIVELTSAEDDNILFVSCGLIIETQNSADGEAKSQQVNKIEGIILFLKKLGNLTRIDSSSFLFK